MLAGAVSPPGGHAPPLHREELRLAIGLRHTFRPFLAHLNPLSWSLVQAWPDHRTQRIVRTADRWHLALRAAKDLTLFSFHLQAQ